MAEVVTFAIIGMLAGIPAIGISVACAAQAPTLGALMRVTFLWPMILSSERINKWNQEKTNKEYERSS